VAGKRNNKMCTHFIAPRSSDYLFLFFLSLNFRFFV
jgi:hypothetical protein